MAPFERNTRKKYSNHLLFGELSHPINDRKDKRLNNFKVFRAEELKHPLLGKDWTYTLKLKGECKRRDCTFFQYLWAFLLLECLCEKQQAQAQSPVRVYLLWPLGA